MYWICKCWMQQKWTIYPLDNDERFVFFLMFYNIMYKFYNIFIYLCIIECHSYFLSNIYVNDAPNHTILRSISYRKKLQTWIKLLSSSVTFLSYVLTIFPFKAVKNEWLKWKHEWQPIRCTLLHYLSLFYQSVWIV